MFDVDSGGEEFWRYDSGCISIEVASSSTLRTFVCSVSGGEMMLGWDVDVRVVLVSSALRFVGVSSRERFNDMTV